MTPLRLNGQTYEWFLRADQGEIRHKASAALVARLYCVRQRGAWHIRALALSARRGDLARAVREMRAELARLRARCRFGVIERGRVRCVSLNTLARGAGSGAPSTLLALQRELAAHTFATTAALPPVREPHRLDWAGRDAFDRDAWLAPCALRAWRRMHAAAARDGECLQIVSAFRSQAYQARLFAGKRARGLALSDILMVNAAPGYSEHHSGRALDLSAPGFRAAETEFEQSSAYAWLCAHASRYGFRLSYPRDNPHGIVYEPWHWCYVGSAALDNT
jgi:hypothetical protein